MQATFACPECGAEVAPSVMAPGRQVRCPVCRTLVEVPFFPRTVGRRRLAQRNRLRIGIGIGAGIAVLVLLLGTIAVERWMDHRSTRYREAEVSGLVAAADRAERIGDLGRALIEMEAARTLAGRHRLANADDLARRRDELARRDIAARLESLDQLDPGQAVGEALTLLELTRRDPAVAAFDGAAAQAVERAHARRAEADLESARQALDAGRGGAALDAAARAFREAEYLPTGLALEIRSEATALARAVAGRHGLVLDEPRGQFFLGAPDLYERILRAPLRERMAANGFVVRPAEPPDWSAAWDAEAPYRLAVLVEETPFRYLQSANRGTKVQIRLDFTRAGARIWSSALTAQTRVPPPKLSAYEAGLLAGSDRRSPEAERRLFQDAVDVLVARVPTLLDGLPRGASPPARPGPERAPAAGLE